MAKGYNEVQCIKLRIKCAFAQGLYSAQTLIKSPVLRIYIYIYIKQRVFLRGKIAVRTCRYNTNVLTGNPKNVLHRVTSKLIGFMNK